MNLLEGEVKDRANRLFEKLNAHGIFVIQIGELEQWLKDLGIQGKKFWLTNILTKLGIQGSDDYIKPGDSDVWKFILKINEWITNPKRLGM